MVVRAGRKELRPIKHTTVFDLLKKEKKMRVRMLKDHRASFDGNNELSLERGKVYDAPERLAGRWLEKGIAMEDKAIDPPKETKPRAKKTTRRKPKK